MERHSLESYLCVPDCFLAADIIPKGKANMPRKTTFRLSLITLLGIVLLLVSESSHAQKRDGFRIDYTVSIPSLDEHLFHVKTNIRNINEPTLELSLPTWTPGWYTVEDYFKNVLRFKVTDSKGNRLQPQMIRKQTWRIETRG